MARVDYFAIEDKIKTVLEADSTLSGVPVLVEEELTFWNKDVIMIYLTRREAPDEGQTLAAGTTTNFHIFFEVWCYAFNLKKRTAMERRDDLIGKVEVALMNDRDLSNTVPTLILRGGDFQNVQGPPSKGFMMGAAIDVEIPDVEATT